MGPSSRRLLPMDLTLFSCLLQLSISLIMDLLLTAGEHVLRRDIANGTVQADTVVMFHVAFHQPPRILQRQRRSRPDALSFERFVPTFDFSVRFVRRCSTISIVPSTSPSIVRFSRLRICPLKVTLLPRNAFATGDEIPTSG